MARLTGLNPAMSDRMWGFDPLSLRSMTRLAVVGTRDFSDFVYIKDKINSLGLDINLIVSGGAKGVDMVAEAYARWYGIPLLVFPVGYGDDQKFGWSTHGRAAGVIRNQKIVDACDEVIAFPKEGGRGTQDTMRKAEKAGKKLHIFPIDKV